jgi:group I intron endonuclease
MGFIYKLTSPSGKAYIGKTTRKAVEIRLKQHRSPNSKCTAIRNAIQKYGYENFVVEKWAFPDEYLLEYEQLFIKDHGTLSPDGYNLKAAGFDNRQTDDVLAVMGEMVRQRWEDPDYRARVTESVRVTANKRWEDPKERENASAAAKRRFEDPEEREKTSHRSKKMWKDPEFRARAEAEAWAKTRWTDDTRAKASASASRKFANNPDQVEKIRAEQKALWEDPEHRARMTKSMTGRKMSEEGRARVREARQRAWTAMTDEQKADRIAKQQAGRQRAAAAKAAAVSGPL